MSAPSILLIAMPWHALNLPSIQSDLLQRVLERMAEDVRAIGFMHEYPISQDYADAAVQSLTFADKAWDMAGQH